MNVTTAEAGLPGSEKTTFLSLVWPREPDDGSLMFVAGIVAKVVGLPGFMETRPKWIVPPNERSMVGLSRSSSPIDTPPVVMRRSTCVRACRRVDSSVSALFEGLC